MSKTNEDPNKIWESIQELPMRAWSLPATPVKEYFACAATLSKNQILIKNAKPNVQASNLVSFLEDCLNTFCEKTFFLEVMQDGKVKVTKIK